MKDGPTHMTDYNPNLNEDGSIKNPNPNETGTETTVNHDTTHAEDTIDYKEKFSASAREAQRLLDSQKEKDAEIERLNKLISTDKGTSYGNSTVDIEGFNDLGEDEQRNLIAYTDSIKRQTLDVVYKDPAFAFAKQTYNEKQWDNAYSEVSKDFPALSKDEFKAKYFKPEKNVPTNIKDLLSDFAKIELFDKARDIGAIQAREQDGRIEIERNQGGDKTPTSSRTVEDWTRLATENPAKFALLSKQFDADMESGKLE